MYTGKMKLVYTNKYLYSIKLNYFRGTTGKAEVFRVTFYIPAYSDSKLVQVQTSSSCGSLR